MNFKKLAILATLTLTLLLSLLMLGGHKTRAAATCSVPSVAYPTIQSAVNDSGCATINVAAGVYAENVSIPRAVTLLGPNAGTSGADVRGPEANVGSLFITAGDVTVDGFTFSNAGPQVQILNLSVVLSGISVKNSIFSGYSSVGFPTNDAGNLVVTGNLFKSPLPGSEAIQIKGPLPGACNGSVVSNNVFIAASDNGGADVNFSCTVTGSTGVTVSGNTDTGLTNDTSFTAFSGVTSGIVVKNNNVTGTPTAGSAIFFFGGVTGAVDISNNVIMGMGDGNGIRVGNFLDGPNSGNFSFTSNDLSGNFRSIRVSDLTSAAVVTFHQNNLSGNSTHQGAQNDATVLTASGQCNWWGSASGPTNIANPGGTGDAAVGMIAFSPWLLSPPPFGACGGGLSSKDCHKAVEDNEKNFNDQQKADKKAFDDQQRAAKQAFDAQPHTEQEKKAFDDQQKADKKAFDDQQDAAKKAFEEQYKADEKACKQ